MGVSEVMALWMDVVVWLSENRCLSVCLSVCLCMCVPRSGPLFKISPLFEIEATQTD